MIIYLIFKFKFYNMVLVMNNYYGFGNKKILEIIRNIRNK